MSKNNFFPISEYYSEAIGKKIAENQNIYGISTFATSSENGSNESTCTNCESTCSGTCSGACTGDCTGTCSGSCSGTCSGGCYGSCKADCSGTCVGNCKGNCAATCSGGCETYCANDCQTYCQYQQTYSKNNGKNNPGGKIFTWDTVVKQDKPIFLTAEEWNRLAGYIEDAADYCSSSSVSITRVSPKDPIYASYYNSMNNGVNKISSSGELNKQKNVDLITESNIDALRKGYNNALILSSLPSNPSGKSNTCCQLQESCMTVAEGRPSLQPCKDGQKCPQTPLN